MKTWQKTILRFCVGGALYFLIEIIWREVLHRAQGAHPIMILPAGTVLALIYFLDDRRWNIFLSALIGALTVVSFELIIGDKRPFREVLPELLRHVLVAA
jgi:hypothetical protein